MAQTNPDVAQRSSNDNLYNAPIGTPTFLEGPLVVRKPDGTLYEIFDDDTVATLIALLGEMGLVTVSSR